MTMAMTTVLPEPVAIFAHKRPIGPPSEGNVNANFLGCGRFREPDQRRDSLQLAEEKPAAIEFLRVRPVLQQSLRDSCNTRIPGFTPCPHARTNPVDQRNFDEMARVVERSGALRSNDVASRPAAVC